MKTLKEYILNEGRTVDTIKMTDEMTNKVIEPEIYAYDKESFDKLIDKIKNNKEYFEDKGIYFAQLKNKSSWNILTSEEFFVKIYNKQNDFFSSDNHTYNYYEIFNMMDNNEFMVVVIVKK